MKDTWLRNAVRRLSSAVSAWQETIGMEIDRLEERLRDLEDRSDALVAQLPDDLRDPNISQRAKALAAAITDERRVMFRYTKEGERDWSLRTLSPYEVIKVSNGTVVRGWDHDRDAIRSFRLDRIEALTICDAFIGADDDPTYPVRAYRKPR